MRKNRFFSWLATLVLASSVMVIGCSQNPTNADTTKQEGDGSKTQATSYPLTFKDDTGQEITIKEEPKRIISLLPSHTEILFALGLGDKIVGVTQWDDYPAEAKKKMIVGGIKPNGEAIIAQKPDLVLASAQLNGNDNLQALRGLGLQVVSYNPKNIHEVENTIRQIGKITNTSTKSEELVQEMESKVKSITDKTKTLKDEEKPRVYVEISSAPEIFTAGQGTFMDELITLSGGKNIAGDLKGFTKISDEQVIAKNPQVIISTYKNTEEMTNDLLARAGWANLDAVKSHRIVGVDKDRASRPGPRIVDGLAEFAKAIHPELFQ